MTRPPAPSPLAVAGECQSAPARAAQARFQSARQSRRHIDIDRHRYRKLPKMIKNTLSTTRAASAAPTSRARHARRDPSLPLYRPPLRQVGQTARAPAVTSLPHAAKNAALHFALAIDQRHIQTGARHILRPRFQLVIAGNYLRRDLLIAPARFVQPFAQFLPPQQNRLVFLAFGNAGNCDIKPPESTLCPKTAQS